MKATPYPGQTVLYREDGSDLPAIVTKVALDYAVDLQLQGYVSQATIADHYLAAQREDVPYHPDARDGHWRHAQGRR